MYLIARCQSESNSEALQLFGRAVVAGVAGGFVDKFTPPYVAGFLFVPRFHLFNGGRQRAPPGFRQFQNDVGRDQRHSTGDHTGSP